jgi:uncharacterized protein (DUF2236 family)
MSGHRPVPSERETADVIKLLDQLCDEMRERQIVEAVCKGLRAAQAATPRHIVDSPERPDVVNV